MAEQFAPPKKVAVIGGGIAGLAAAHHVLEISARDDIPVELKLYESRDRLGGSIVSERRDGYLIEGGPDSFITQKPWALALCKRLGIEDQLVGTNPDYRRTYVVHRGRMHPIPEGFLLLAPTRIMPFVFSRLFSWPGKMRMGMDFFLPARKLPPDGDVSLADFVRYRFGSEALRRIAQPLVGGIYTADPEKLSLRTTMPRFLDMEAEHGSLIRAMRKGMVAARKRKNVDSGARYSMFMSFREGIETLVRALEQRLPAGSVQTNRDVRRIDKVNNQWRIGMGDGHSAEADAVILACPSHAAARMVENFDTLLADKLEAIPFASSATLTLAVRRDQVQQEIDGFGFVVPAAEKRTLIAVTYNSVKYEGRAPQGWVQMRAFLGGALQPEVFAMSDGELHRAVMRDLRELIGLRGEPAFTELYRWPMSMPQYPVGHLQHLESIEARLGDWPGLAVAGNAYSGVGIPDCIHSGEQAAEKILRSS